MADISTKPYLIRAIHSWCEDSGYRPYIAVVVDQQTQVPMEFVRNGEIVLNVSAQATNRLRIGNELIEFEARFSGTVRAVSIPIDNVSAIYAQETGHGMAFDVVRSPALEPQPAPVSEAKRTERIVTKPRLVPSPKPKATSETAVTADAKPDAEPQRAATVSDATDQRVLPEAGTAAPVARKATRSPRRRKPATAVVDVGPEVIEAPLVAEPGSEPPSEEKRPRSEDPDKPKSARGHLKRIK